MPVAFIDGERREHLMMPNNDFIFNTADPVFCVDRDLRIALWNEPIKELLGYSAKEVLGRHCYSLLGCRNGSGQPLCHDNCMELLEKNPPKKLTPTREFLAHAKNGRDVWVNISTIFMPSRSKNMNILVHIFRDISFQKGLERFIESLQVEVTKLSMKPENDPPKTVPDSPPPATITGREEEILRLLASGASTRAIAKKLFISSGTVRNHINNILSKLDVHSRLEAVILALRRGLI
jgi:PAS domain S-box-containing protein